MSLSNEEIVARMAEDQRQFVAHMTAIARPRDFVADFGHENGCYECCCCYCGISFLGHKRRVVCGVCDRALNELL